MSRLTSYNEKQKQYIRLASRLAVDNKLGKLEDLEEQLGCPLEIVNEALKNGIWNGVPEHIRVGLVYIPLERYGNYFLTCFDENGNQTGCYPLREWLKTWWLKEDKSE